MSSALPSSFSASLFNPIGHGSASGNGNGNKAEASILSHSNLSWNVNLFSPETHNHQAVVVNSPPEKQKSSPSIAGTLVLGVVTMASAAVGAVMGAAFMNKGNGDEERVQKGKGVRVKVTGGVYGTIAAEVMGTAMHAPDEEDVLEEKD